MNPRQRAEKREAQTLGPYAALASRHGGRGRDEPECEVRTAFQRDCHRIVHSKSFRRLKGKTQVFLWPEGDHYRTRMTHCLEVSQLARTIARGLELNEDLTEAIAMGHDLGHTPFGHAGEEAMQRLVPGGFRHEQQSLRVVMRLENEGRGLNLTREVLDGIGKHSKGTGKLVGVDPSLLPATYEGCIVRLADIFAYANHDLDDALRARVIERGDLPEIVEVELGSTHSARLTRLVRSVMEASSLEDGAGITIEPRVAAALEHLRDFLFEKVYFNPKVHGEFCKASGLIESLWNHFLGDLERFYEVYWPTAPRDGEPEDDVRDFLAGMTDAFAVNLYERIFTPRRWYVL